MTEAAPLAITGWHAHVYYDDAESRARAARVREGVDAEFDVRLGRWRDEPVGPHLKPMFQIAFAPEAFAAVVAWLALHHDGLAVLIHPETGDHVADHTEHALWLGDRLGVNVDALQPRD